MSACHQKQAANLPNEINILKLVICSNRTHRVPIHTENQNEKMNIKTYPTFYIHV